MPSRRACQPVLLRDAAGGEDEGRRPSLEVERDFRLVSLRRVKSEAA